jgi:porin
MATFVSRSLLNPTLVAGLSLAAVVSAPYSMAADHDVFTRPYMTGDWGGQRQRLEDAGVKLSADYVSETMGNVQGGNQTGTRYAQQVRMGARLDLSRLLGTANGGVVQLTINDRRGNNTSNDLVGNRLAVQEVAGFNYTRLTEASYARSLFTPDLQYKVGYMAMGNEFGAMQVLTNFVNAGFCAHPLSMSGGSGWGNYPNAHWGAEIKYQLTPAWMVQTAIFQVDADSNSQSRYAFRMKSYGASGNILPVEAVYTYGGALPGQYKFGWYYDTSNAARIGHAGESSGRSGTYILADQTVWRDSADAERELHLFGQATQTDVATSPFSHWYSAGVVLHKPFAHREHDTLGFAYGRAVLNSRTRDVQEQQAANLAAADSIANLDSGEQLLEISYGAQLTPWLLVRPDVQYVIEPGAFYGTHQGNALLAGLQVKATF